MTNYSKLTMAEIVRDLAFHYARMEACKAKDEEIRQWMRQEYGQRARTEKEDEN